jgi:hypothetical protein
MPDTFDGSKNGPAVADWLFTVAMYLTLAAVAPTMHVMFAVALLRGGALRWWREKLGNHAAPATFDAFRAAITSYYQPPHQQLIVRNRLLSLSQQGSAARYTDLFRELALKVPDLTDMERLTMYLRGLRPGIRDLVITSDCRSFDSAVERALYLDSATSAFDSQLNPSGRSGNQPRTNSNTFRGPRPQSYASAVSSSSSSSGPTPMELGAAVFKKLTDSERQALRKSGACFYCRKQGHRALECPVKALRARGAEN